MDKWAGAKVRDLSDGGKIKTVESLDPQGKLSISDDNEWVAVVSFTDGTWAYAESTELVSLPRG